MFVKTATAIAAIAAIATAAPVSAAKKLVVFGASFDDNGSTHHDSSMQAYWNGRYSNSYVWPEYAAKILGLTLSDNAYGGATSDNSFVYAQGANGPITSVHDAIQNYINTYTNEPAGLRAAHTVIIDIGGNDAFYSTTSLASGAVDISTFVSNLTSHIYSDVGVLVNAGFRNIYIANIQPLGIMPFATTNDIVPLAEALESTIVGSHTAALASFKKQYGTAANNVKIFDMAASFRAMMDTEVVSAMNILNSSTECISYDSTGSPAFCTDPDTHMFFDDFHPCGRPHYLLGVLFANIVSNPAYVVNTRNLVNAVNKYNIGTSSVTKNIIVS
ncbi:hypothetical protein GQ54DRAFT_313289 [Martensiomyces pterosporus]|nr:hypothetical protein GQ54DRAFT_313289 [Martensiomyces pterosporus]